MSSRTSVSSVVLALLAFGPWAVSCDAARPVAGDDPARAESTSAPVPLDHARHGHCLEELPGGALLVFGGFSNAAGVEDRGTRETWMLPVGAERWQRRADLPWPQAFAGSACIDGVPYAVGDGVLRYDAATGRWIEVVARGTLPVSHFACAAVGDTVYVLGGFPAERAGPWRIDVASSDVQRVPAFPGFTEGSHFHIAAELAGVLHVIGGLDGGRPARRHVRFDGSRWRELDRPPVGMWAKFAVVACRGDRLWCFSEAGGWCFDAGSGWTRVRGLERVLDRDPALLAMPAAWVDGPSIWVLGGTAGGGGRPMLLRYDIRADRWEDLVEGE